MIFHSYGGVVGCEALKEYVSEASTGKGGKQGWGKVRRLVFVASFVLPEGGSLMAALNFEPLPWFDVDVSRTPTHSSAAPRSSSQTNPYREPY